MLVADIDEEGGRRTVASMERGRFCKADVRREADWKGLVEAAKEAFGGRVDCLVNCAGGTYRNKVGDNSSVRSFVCTCVCVGEKALIALTLMHGSSGTSRL